jgi:hypothetical protein
LVQAIKNVDNGLGGVALPDEGQHQIAGLEHHREQNLASNTPDERINLNNGNI